MIGEIFSNDTLWCGLAAWTICQVLKTVINRIRTHRWNLRNLIDSGGMPSSHSASVVAVTVSAGLREGFSSTLFALGVVFSLVVMYDATGVRRETGKQGKLINSILQWPEAAHDNSPSSDLKEKLGHSPLEVVVGTVIGVICALAFYHFFRTGA